MQDFEKEARVRWGESSAYKEHEQKTAGYNAEKWQEVNDGLMAIFVRFANCKKEGNRADSAAAQALVKSLQSYITENYYTCTNEILAGLGQMYISDTRFLENIDKCATGTAEFASEAIKIYCKGNEI